MNPLIAVVTCRPYRKRAEAQRLTWAKDAEGVLDVRWFVGNGMDDPMPHEVHLDVDDGYFGLPDKVQEVCRWALSHGYTHIFRTDDDVYIRPERVLAQMQELVVGGVSYAGRVRGPSDGYTRTEPHEHVMWPAPYCSGFGYLLDEKAMRLIAQAPRSEDPAEDRWVGNLLLKEGIAPVQLEQKLAVVQAKNAGLSGIEGPRRGNDIIAACEYEGTHMMLAHTEFRTLLSSTLMRERGLEAMPRISILIKTFLRDRMLHRTLRAVERHLPGSKMIVVDDGYEHRDKISRYADLRSKGHDCLWLPFDSGFGAKANAGVAANDREFVLIASDDFEFAKPGVAEGIGRMVTVLDNDPDIGVASGRVGGNPYEGHVVQGVDPITDEVYLQEIPLTPYPDGSDWQHADGVPYHVVDLTVNYCLVRKEVFDYVKWDEDYKIGGDHYTWMRDVRMAGFRIAYVHGANINQIPAFPGSEHRDYGKYRARAKRALPLFFHKQGIDRYVGFDGRVDRVKRSADKINWSIQ